MRFAEDDVFDIAQGLWNSVLTTRAFFDSRLTFNRIFFPLFQKGRDQSLFDNATSCSSENSVVILNSVYADMIEALKRAGGELLDASEKAKLQQVMFPGGKLSPATTAQSAEKIAGLAGLSRKGKFLMVEESGTGREFPFSGEKLAPVLALYKARDFDEAFGITSAIYDYQGKGHSVSLHSKDESQALRLGLEMMCSVCRNHIPSPLY